MKLLRLSPISLIFESDQKQVWRESLAETEFLTRLICDPRNSITHPQEVLKFAKKGRQNFQRWLKHKLYLCFKGEYCILHS